MLRVVAHKSAAAARQYYAEGLKREDYYAQGQEVVGKWHGKAARLLDVSGDVTPEAFAALVENRHPETGKQLTPRMRMDRRVGYDLNFHAPKSVSLLHALTGDERIVSAFRSAVAETMAEIEALASTRVRRGGAQAERFTGNLVWAEFVHFTARPVGGIPDPHLHIHAYAMNLSFDDVEKRWKAVSWARIKKDAPYCEAVFHSRLSAKLVELGYGIERSPKGWEIQGIPRSLVEKFSRRTAQIEDLAKRKGITDPTKKDALGAASREGKRRGLTSTDLLGMWESRLTPDERNLLKTAGRNRQAPKERITPAKAFDEACEKCFAKASVVEAKRLVAEALHYGVGHFSPEQAWGEFNRRKFVTRQIGDEMLCTSLEVLAEEVALINFVRSGRGTRAPIKTGDVKLSNEALSAEKKAALRHILNSKDQVICIRGAAGTGKTTLMREAQHHIESSGFRLFAFAPSASASRETLRQEGFANAETVAHLLANKKLQEEIRGQVIWVDEAGQIGMRDLWDIMQLTGNSTTVILTGDIAQHAPVPRGDPLRLIPQYSGLRVAELTEIHRQEREDYRRAVMALSKGDLRTGFRRLGEIGAIVEVPDDAQRYQMLAGDYLSLSRGGPPPLVVSPTHAEGAHVTAAIRDARRDAGQLGPEKTFIRYQDLKWEVADRRRAENYLEGMVVQFHQNVRGIRRGTVLRILETEGNGGVRAVDPSGREVELPLKEAARFQVFEPQEIGLSRGDRIRITRNGKSTDGRRLNNGNVFTVNGIGRDGTITLHTGAVLKADFGHFTYGYCQTSHSAQSKSVRDVLVAQSADSIFSSSREQFYVSVSRGKETLRIYTDDVQELQKAVGNTSTRRAGVELAGFSSREIAGLMNELNSKQWRDLIQSRRAEGVAKTHVQNLLKERRQDGLRKPENMDFRQYIIMRRELSGADGKSRSKGHPHAVRQGKGNTASRGKSFLRPTELTVKAQQKISQAHTPKETKKTPLPTRQNRAVKAIAAAKNHFKKVAERTKTAMKSFKQGKRSKLFPERSPKDFAKHRVKNNAGGAKAKTRTKTQQKAPTPPPPRPRR